MKEKKINVEYIISGMGRYEKTELKGMKSGEEFNLGNGSLMTIKIEEINENSCVLLFDTFKVKPDRGEYIEIYKKDEIHNIDIPEMVYKMSVNLNEEINFEPPVCPAPDYSMKITSIYSEEVIIYS